MLGMTGAGICSARLTPHGHSSSSIGPRAISLASHAALYNNPAGRARLLLLGVGVATMANNIAYGVSGSKLASIYPCCPALLGGLCLLQVAGTPLVTRAQRPHV